MRVSGQEFLRAEDAALDNMESQLQSACEFLRPFACSFHPKSLQVA